jgi:hypothetical protein
MAWHLKSTKHKERMMELEGLSCKTCNFHCKYPSAYASHLSSKAHKAKENPQPKVIKTWSCSICDITIGSHKDELRHLETRKHAKNVAKAQALGVDNLAKPVLVHALE